MIQLLEDQDENQLASVLRERLRAFRLRAAQAELAKEELLEENPD